MVGIALHDGQEGFSRAGIGDVDGRIEAVGMMSWMPTGVLQVISSGYPHFLGARMRNSGRRFIGPGFAKEVVVAQHFAVVGCEDGQAVVETTGILDEAADLIIYKVDHTVISGNSACRVRQGKFARRWGRDLFEFGCPVSDDGIGQIALDIAVVIEGRWGKRGMGIDKGYVEKKWVGSRFWRKSIALSIHQKVCICSSGK